MTFLVVLRRKLPLAVIPGRWQVGVTDLPASPESITTSGVVDGGVRIAGPVVIDSRLRSQSSRPRNDGIEQFVTQ
jgi:hypothetical protein